MAKTAGKTVRDLRLAAMTGDHSAARALLRLYGKGHLADEIKPGKPFSPRVQTMVRALTAGTNADGTVSEWERVQPDGTIVNILHDAPGRRAHWSED